MTVYKHWQAKLLTAPAGTLLRLFLHKDPESTVFSVSLTLSASKYEASPRRRRLRLTVLYDALMQLKAPQTHNTWFPFSLQNDVRSPAHAARHLLVTIRKAPWEHRWCEWVSWMKTREKCNWLDLKWPGLPTAARPLPSRHQSKNDAIKMLDLPGTFLHNKTTK